MKINRVEAAGCYELVWQHLRTLNKQIGHIRKRWNHCQRTTEGFRVYIYGDFFSSSLDIFVSFVGSRNEMGTNQDRRDLPFPFQDTITAPTDHWTFGSRGFVLANLIFPKEIFGTFLWYLTTKNSQFLELAVWGLTCRGIISPSRLYHKTN